MAKTKKVSSKATKRGRPRKPVTTESKAANKYDSMFVVSEGIPDAYTRMNGEEREALLQKLSILIPNKNNLVVPWNLRNSIRNIATRAMPEAIFRLSYNKEKELVYIWRTA